MKCIIHKPIVTLLLCAGIIFSCKKSKPPQEDMYSGSKELTIERILEALPMLAADRIAASMDGKYLCTYNYQSPLFASFCFSTNNGLSWEATVTNKRAYNALRITKGGYTYLGTSTSGGAAALFNLNTKQDVAINYTQGSIGSTEEFYLGHDDYVYARNHFKKIGENNWQTMPAAVTGVYCGQDVNNGGIAFFDEATKKLYIHNPTNNTATTYNINIEIERIVSYGVLIKPYFLYNGYNEFAIAHTKGVTIQDLGTNAVNFTAWPAAYKDNNPSAVSIDKEGTVFTTLGSSTAPTLNFKIENGKFTSFYRKSELISRGDYTYYLGGAALFKESKGGRQKIQGLTDMLEKTANVARAALKAATVAGAKIYAVIHLTHADAASGALFTYTANNKDFEMIERTAGRYDYVYTEGANIYLYGVDSILYSANNGTNWSGYVNSAGTAKSINYVTKAGTTYYALHVFNYKKALGSTGHQVDQHNLTTYSSTDAINWKVIASKTGESGLGPEILTADGLMAYRYNANSPTAVADMKTMVSYDYGKTWAPSGGFGFNGVYNNELFLLSYNGQGLDVRRYDKIFKELSKQSAKPSGNFDVAGIKNVTFESEGKINFINSEGFFKIR